jgi:16S rRNA (adenine1518-N6/adenine1519-N6)-dimethyltransferase
LGRRLGQHFLFRKSILDRIAEAACGDHVERVIEIGPGKGALTESLLARADKVVAIEVDPHLVHYLNQKFRDPIDAGQLEVIEGDILQTDFSGSVIAGNLPYYITSPILHRLFESAACIEAIHVVIQMEVAERLTARPGSRAYGYLSVLAQFYSRPAIRLRIPPGAFRPPPKVYSALVSLPLPGERAGLGIEDASAFFDFVKVCFAQKRKTLWNNLRASLDEAVAKRALDATGILPRARAEQLTLAQFADLFRAAREFGSSSAN